MKRNELGINLNKTHSGRHYFRSARRLAWLNIAIILTVLFSFFQGMIPGNLRNLTKTALAHNLQTEMVNMFLDSATQALLDGKVAGGWTPGTPILTPGDTVGLYIKVIPRETTTTGVGGHVDFYIPDGTTVLDAAYVVPDGSGGYIEVGMKGQSPIATGDGPIGAKSTSQLIGMPAVGPNINGITANPVVPATGLHRGTIAGLYGDTGIFFSTDPDTSYGSWQRFTGDWNNTGNNHCGLLQPLPLGNGYIPPAPNGKNITNNSGDIFVPCNKWDAEQMYAWGVKGTSYTGPGAASSPIVDYGDGRGNAPWGFASGVAGPQSGYAWNFDWDEWVATGNMQAAMDNSEIGPWQRLKYPGSRISYDQPGLIGTTLGYANIDGSNVGVYDLKTTDLPSTTSQTDNTSPKTIRWAVGQLTAFRPEYVFVKLRVDNVSLGSFLNSSGCPVFHSDTFGGDAGGTDNGKDHLWRYYQPSEFTWNGCLAVGKTTGAQFVKVGDIFTYKLKVYNLGSTPQTNVSIEDKLPSTVQFISAVPAQNSGPNPLIWNIGTLNTNQYFEATLTAKALATGVIDNCVKVTSDQGIQNSCESIVGGKPFLVPTKSVTPTTVSPGGIATYTILVKNIGSGATYSPVTINDYLPPGLSYQSLTQVLINGSNITSSTTVNSTNPNQPVFTVPSAIQALNELRITFNALVSNTQPTGNFCNYYSVTQGGVPITSGSEACVTVGGGQIGDTIFRDWNGNGAQGDGNPANGNEGEEGMAGVTVTLYKDADNNGSYETLIGTAVTDANGYYLFTGLTAGNYQVSVPAPGSGGVPTGYTLTADPNGAPITNTFNKTLASNEVYLGADWGYQPGGTGSIGDQVFSDANNNGLFDAGDVGIPNVTVNLYEDTNGNGVIDTGDLLIKTTTTNGSGVYNFTGLATGLSYIVDVVDADITTYFSTAAWQATTADPQPVPNLVGSYVNADFGYYKIIPGSIGDEVFEDNNGNGVYDSGDQYLPNITVSLYRDYDGDGQPDSSELVGTTESDANGHYLFDNLPPGNYISVVSTNDPDLPAGLASTTSSFNITLAAAQVYTTADFPFAPLISKTVDKASAAPGDTLNFTVKVNYPGSKLLNGVKVIDPLPIGVNCGTVGQGGTCGAYSPTAGVPGESATDTTGMGIYSDNSNTPQFNLWDGAAFDVQTASVNIGNTPRVLSGAAAPTRDEKIVVAIVNGNPEVRGMLWNGTTWAYLPQPPALDASGSLANLASDIRDRWSGAVAYEQLSGDAVLVWDNGTTGTTGLSFNTWNGTAWSTNATITTPLSGEPSQMRIAAKPGSDEVVLAVSNTSAFDYALVWNGSSWGNSVTLDSASGGSQTAVHVAYEQQSGKAMVVYGKNADVKLYYRVWNGTSWSAEASLDPTSLGVTTQPQWISLASDPTSNRLAVGVVTSGGRTWLAVWDGSAWGNMIQATATSLTAAALNVAVTFETQSGDLMAAYGVNAAPLTQVRYRTKTSAGAWSSETLGPDLTDGNPSVLVLSRDPNSDEIMLTTNHSSADANYTLWDGNAWGTPFEGTNNTGSNGINQPVLFLYDQHLPASSLTTLTASPTTVAQGGTVTLVMTLKSTKTISQVTPSTITVHNGSATCVGPTEAVPATVQAGVAKTFTYTCTPTSLGEIWFTGNASSAVGYDFAEGTSNTVLVSPDGSSSVVTWNLGSNTDVIPGTVSTGGTQPVVYAFQGGTTAFWGYTTTTNAWATKAATPNNNKKGAGLTYLAPYIYGTRGDAKTSFYRCDTTTTGVAGACDTSWTTRANTLGNIGEGGALTNDGTYVYALRGDGKMSFYRYDPTGNSWTALADTPANVKKGGALVYVSPYIYAFQGDNKTGFWRYDIGANTWTAMANAPANIGWGGSLTYVSPYIYAMQGNGKNLFWRYDIGANTWITRATTPGNVSDGGALTTNGTYIFALQGKTTGFWRYDPTANTWATLASTPANTAQGGALTFVPGTSTVSRLTLMSAFPTLVSTGGKFTIKIELTSATAVNNISPSALTTTPTGGASCSALTGPTLVSADDDLANSSDKVIYQWECTAAAGTNPGSLKFSASASGDGGATSFASATTNSVLVTPLLTFSATVKNPIDPPGLQLVENTAIIDDASDPAPQPPVCYIIADSKTGGVDDNDILVGWNQSSNSIFDIGTGTGTTHAEAATWNLDFTKLYTTDRDPTAAAGSDRFGVIDTGTGLYTPISRLASVANPLEGSLGNFTVLDVDGMSFDPLTGKLYAIHRREDATNGNTLLDVLFQIDPVAGFHVEDAFGAGVDYLVLQTNLLPTPLYDVDDIAFHPSTGELYAIANDSTTSVGDQDRLIKINKNSGALTDLGRITNNANGAGIDDMEGLGFQSDGALYGTTGTDTSTPNRLWQINLSTAVATLIAAFPSHADYEAIACSPGGATDVPIPPTPSNTTETALTASIGDFVWADIDGDGVQDSGEPGLSGVKVYIDSNNNGVWDTGEPYDTSDGFGKYRIFGLTASTYTVRTDPSTYPTDYTPTTDTSLSVTLSAGQQYNNADFGLQPPGNGSIGDYVWLDADSDGVQDATESGIPNITVNLYRDLDGNGLFDPAIDAYLGTDTTDPNGFYSFSGLPTASGGNPVKYLVIVDETSDVISPYGGGSADLSAAMDPTTGTVNPKSVTLSNASPTVINADFGYNWAGSIGDFVWYDNNANGVYEPGLGETGVNGAFVMVYWDMNNNNILEPGEPQIGSAFTNSGGIYSVTNLPPGNYIVDVYEDSIPVPGGGTIDLLSSTGETHAVDLAPAQNYLLADFGYFQGAIVEGTVFHDVNHNGLPDSGEPGLTPVTVTLTGYDENGNFITKITTTNGSGDYKFLVPAGNYTVTYSTSDVLTINPSLTEPTTPISVSVVAKSGEHTSDIDFGVDNAGKIGDFVWNDPANFGIQNIGEPGIPNVTVNLYDSSGTNLLASTATDSEGKYLFEGWPDGTYVVKVDATTAPSGYAATTPTQYTATVVGGGSDLDNDFGFKPPANTFTVSGKVYDSSDNSALPGVTVCIYEQTSGNLVACTTTDSGGNYSFPGIPNGGYHIDVFPDTLPSAVYQPTFDPDGIGTPNTTGVTVNGASVGNQNFGYDQVYGSISGTVCDGNGDGLCDDPGETPGISGVPVFLTYAGMDSMMGTTDDVVYTTLTDGSGNYTFTSLAPGIYQVTKSNPTGKTSLADADGGNPNNITVNLNPGQNKLDQDFEVKPATGLIGDTVWLDSDGDGVQDAGEPGLANVVVELKDGAGNPIDSDPFTPGIQPTTTTTNQNGNYLFSDVPAGTYQVDIISGIPGGLTPSAGTNDPSANFILAAGESKLDVDFGYKNSSALTAVIGDFVWSDDNANGIQDPGEPGIAGVSLTLKGPGADGILGTGDDTTAATAFTGPDGHYYFTGVTPGDYIVDVTTPAGYTLTSGSQSNPDPSNPITVAAGDTYLDADFGYQKPSLATITDQVWYDADRDGIIDAGESGITGVTVNLWTDPNGDGDPSDGVIIATAISDSTGTFTFPGLPNGDYVIQISDTAGVLTDLQYTTPEANTGLHPVTVAGADVSGSHFGYAGLGPIGDTIFSDHNGNGTQDAGEPGIANVQVKLYFDDGDGVFEPGAGDTLIQTTTTDGSGTYLFNDLPAGTFWVSVDDNQANLSGYTPTTADQDPATATTTEYKVSLTTTEPSFLDADYGYQNTSLADVSGTVFNDVNKNGLQNPTEPGIPDVTVCLVNNSGVTVACTVTDANGDYSFFDVPPGNYTVVVTDDLATLEDYVLTSGLDEIPITVGGTDITNVDFGYVRNQATGSIGDYVWHDADRDGVQDAAEAGIAGVTLELKDSAGNPIDSDPVTGGIQPTLATTDANGGYLFKNLPAGNYTVDVVSGLPSGMALTTGSTDPTGKINLSAGEAYDKADFGYAGQTNQAIGDTVWYDANGDGIQDAGEVGIGGVKVTVTGPSCPSGCVVFTDSTGFWLVPGLTAGTYTVAVDPSTLPSGYNTTPTNGAISRSYAVPNGSDVLYADFGFNGGTTGTIGDTVWLDANYNGLQDGGETGIPGVTINLYKDSNNNGVIDPGEPLLATTTTDTNGNYQFVGVPNGDYLVQVSDVDNALSGLVQSHDPDQPGVCTTCNNLADATVSGGVGPNTIDFGYAPAGGTIGNLIWHDTNGDGNVDPGESGIEGVTLNLWLDVNGNSTIEPGVDNLVRSTITDENGLYEFKGLPTGTYLVDVTDRFGVLSGFTKTTGTPNVDNNSQADPYPVVLTTGAPGNFTADFGYTGQTPHTISGYTFQDLNGNAFWNVPTEPDVPNVLVLLYRDQNNDGIAGPGDPVIGITRTDINGFYEFTNLPDGNYVVSVNALNTTVDGWFQTTQKTTAAVQPINLLGADSTDNNFGFNYYNPTPTSVTVGSFIANFVDQQSIIIKWSTTLEIDVVGYNLYRSTSPNGTLVLVNPTLIPGSNNQFGGQYEYTDTNVQAGVTYYYYLYVVTAPNNKESAIEIAPAVAVYAPEKVFLPFVQTK